MVAAVRHVLFARPDEFHRRARNLLRTGDSLLYQVLGGAPRDRRRSAPSARALSRTCTACLRPGVLSSLAASKLMSLPPNTGQSLIAAHSMSGSFRSRP